MNILTNSKIQGFKMCDDTSKPYNIPSHNSFITKFKGASHAFFLSSKL